MLSSFLHEPERKGNRGDRPSWWISSYRFVSDPIDEWRTAPPSRGRFAFRLRTRGQTSTLIGDWRHPLTLDELTRAVLLSISREATRRLLPGTDAEADLGVRPIGWGTR